MLLSRNYAPSDDLSPYIRQHYVFEAHLPEGFELIDQLMSLLENESEAKPSD